MNKDVLVYIKGLHMEVASDKEEIETVVRAQYYPQDKGHYIEYDDFTAGVDNLAHTSLYIDKDRFELTRDGDVSMVLCFEKDLKSTTGYVTPSGDFMIGVTTKEFDLKETPDLLSLKIDYALEVNYMFVGNCKVSLNVENIQNEPIL